MKSTETRIPEEEQSDNTTDSAESQKKKGQPASSVEFLPVGMVDRKWAEDYKKEFGEEPSFF